MPLEPQKELMAKNQMRHLVQSFNKCSLHIFWNRSSIHRRLESSIKSTYQGTNMNRIAICAVLVFFASSAFSATYYLKREWNEKGNHMCEYDNGTVLNVGGGFCPRSVEGQ
jgi:hypothetical protein